MAMYTWSAKCSSLKPVEGVSFCDEVVSAMGDEKDLETKVVEQALTHLAARHASELGKFSSVDALKDAVSNKLTRDYLNNLGGSEYKKLG